MLLDPGCLFNPPCLKAAVHQVWEEVRPEGSPVQHPEAPDPQPHQLQIPGGPVRVVSLTSCALCQTPSKLLCFFRNKK